jgi:hypothetical protein
MLISTGKKAGMLEYQDAGIKTISMQETKSLLRDQVRLQTE